MRPTNADIPLQLFPGLIYRMIKPKVVLLIFVSGKIVLTGAKVKFFSTFFLLTHLWRVHHSDLLDMSWWIRDDVMGDPIIFYVWNTVDPVWIHPLTLFSSTFRSGKRFIRLSTPYIRCYASSASHDVDVKLRSCCPRHRCLILLCDIPSPSWAFDAIRPRTWRDNWKI